MAEIKKLLTEYRRKKLIDFDTLLLVVFLLLSLSLYFVFPALSEAGTGWRLALLFAYYCFYLSVLVVLAAGLLFDGIRQYSRYGISHHHYFLNHLISSIGVILPASVVLFGMYPLILSCALFAYSQYVSPISADEKTIPFYYRVSVKYVINFSLCVLVLLVSNITLNHMGSSFSQKNGESKSILNSIQNSADGDRAVDDMNPERN